MNIPNQVVLLGSKGAAGKMHAQAYQHLNVTVRGFDIVDGPISEADILSINWPEVIVDVCTPTVTHIESLTWAYALGARKFILEKPAALSNAEWRGVLPRLPGALIFVTLPYLFSKAFRYAVDLVCDVVEIDCVFNKDRAHDDARFRGADVSGILPHALLIEGPHQMAMLLAIAPTLAVSQVHCVSRGARGASPAVPLDCSVTMADSIIRRASLSTDLRAPRERRLQLVGKSGDSITVHFSTNSELEARVERQTGSGPAEIVWSGRDDIMQRTLAAAIASINSGAIPWEASAAFSSIVLAALDDAMARQTEEPELHSDKLALDLEPTTAYAPTFGYASAGAGVAVRSQSNE
jgi:predicted dehydrogenase